MSKRIPYVVCWSGGKDSTGTILCAKERGIPIDQIVFSEVYYDLARGISGEHPEHMAFILRCKAQFEAWGYPVTIVHAKKDYLTNFYHYITRGSTEHIGKHYGFCLPKQCSIKRDCKLAPIQQFLQHAYPDGYCSLVGICADEPKRLASLTRTGGVSLLAHYGYTQADTRDLCERYDMLSPVYDLSKRGGCWFCPWATYEEHQRLYLRCPSLFQEFVALEQETPLAYAQWNPYTKERLADRYRSLVAAYGVLADTHPIAPRVPQTFTRQLRLVDLLEQEEFYEDSRY